MPKVAAASTGAVRPMEQCVVHYARRLPLAPVLVPARTQFLHEMRPLLLLSLMSFFIRRRVQVSTGRARTPLDARL